MPISVEVSTDVQQEAATRGMPVFAFVELLMQRGLESLRDTSSVSSAVERIRALRRTDPAMPPTLLRRPV